MVVALPERGLFGSDEWTAMLGNEIKVRSVPAILTPARPTIVTGLRRFKRVVAHKGIADRATLARYHDAWDRAAERTPHGAPIELTARDFAAK